MSMDYCLQGLALIIKSSRADDETEEKQQQDRRQLKTPGKPLGADTENDDGRHRKWNLLVQLCYLSISQSAVKDQGME